MPTKDFLSQILEEKRKDLKEKNTFFSLLQLRLLSKTPHLKRFFKERISQPGRMNLIAEIKRASPSRGIIRKDFDPVKIAQTYQAAGADALSVITEEHFFKGSLAILSKIRKHTSLPILRKDFILEEYQVYESYVHGADAILLIAEILEEKQLAGLIALAERLGLDALVEVHDAENLKKAVSANAKIIGINNRDLRFFKTDLQTTARLRPLIPADKIVVSESGIKTPDGVTFLKGLNVSAVLIGEAFLESEDIAAKVKSLIPRQPSSSNDSFPKG